MLVESGNRIGYLPWPEAIIREAGGDFLLMHVSCLNIITDDLSNHVFQHGDLHQMLYDIAIRSGVQVEWNTSVAAVLQGIGKKSKSSVVLWNGKILTADIVVGADGPDSMVRESMFGASKTSSHAEITLYSATVSSAQISRDPELQSFLRKGEVRG